MSLSANSNGFPRMLRVRQVFPPSKSIDIDQSLREQFETSGLSEQIKPQQRIAILISLALDDVQAARIVRISDTLSLESMPVSEAYLDELAHDSRVKPVGDVEEMKFDSTDNLLLPLSSNH